MCGRAYQTYTDSELAARYLNDWPLKLPSFKVNYNLCPTQLSPVVLMSNSEVQIEMMRFGLVPSWAGSLKDAAKYSLINAMAETIQTKKSYKEAFIKRRCLLPVSGFFEWVRPSEGPKRPFAIHLKNGGIMSLAAVYERWISKHDGEVVDSFSIITTGANGFMSAIHDRMPVILAEDQEKKWLDPGLQNCDELLAMLQSCPESWLEADEVSTLVNSPINNSPEILRPVKPLIGR